MEAFRATWPTPAEAMAKQHTQNGVQRSSMEYSNTSQQFQRQTKVSNNNPFLQPSVNPSNFEKVLHTTLIDRNMDVSVADTNIHNWSKTLTEEMAVSQHMHPAILSQLKPCQTEDDHNCLYNAICLCLGMPQLHQNDLRERTALCILKYSDHFRELLKYSDGISLQTLIQQCRQPFCFEGWGNEFHILALAIMLKRNIIVYTTFKDPNGLFYQMKDKNIVQLAEEFKKGGDKIEQHMNFEPQEGITSHNPLFIQLNGLHFTALVPRLPNPIYCIPPATNLPSIPDNGLINPSPSPNQCGKKTRKTRWLASKTPAQLAEYKARRREKKKERKHTPEASKSENLELVEENSTCTFQKETQVSDLKTYL